MRNLIKGSKLSNLRLLSGMTRSWTWFSWFSHQYLLLNCCFLIFNSLMLLENNTCMHIIGVIWRSFITTPWTLVAPRPFTSLRLGRLCKVPGTQLRSSCFGIRWFRHMLYFIIVSWNVFVVVSLEELTFIVYGSLLFFFLVDRIFLEFWDYI